MLLVPDLQQRLENDHLARSLRIPVLCHFVGILAVLGLNLSAVREQIWMIADLSQIDQTDEDLRCSEGEAARRLTVLITCVLP